MRKISKKIRAGSIKTKPSLLPDYHSANDRPYLQMIQSCKKNMANIATETSEKVLPMTAQCHSGQYY